MSHYMSLPHQTVEDLGNPSQQCTDSGDGSSFPSILLHLCQAPGCENGLPSAMCQEGCESTICLVPGTPLIQKGFGNFDHPWL